MSHLRNGPSGPEGVRLLQPLIPHPQKRWRPTAHYRSQNPESHPHETAVQDDYVETDPLANICLFRNRSLSPTQIISENAGPHGHRVPSATVGPASYVAPSALAETEGFIRCLASWTPMNQSEPGLRDSPGPLEMSSVDETGRTLSNGLQ